MSTPTLGCLSEDGWQTDPLIINDQLLSHFFASDYSQDNIFYGSVTSFAYIVQRAGNDIYELCSLLKEALTKYYSRYFQNVDINIVDSTSDKPTSYVEITMSIRFMDSNGEQHDVGKIIETDENLKVKKIIDIVNG